MKTINSFSKAKSLVHNLLKRRADTIIALASLLIAALALWSTLDQMRRSENLERLRWQPSLSWGIYKNLEEGFGITLSNQGLGPAKIKWVKVYRGKRLIADWNELYQSIVDMTGNLPTGDIDRIFRIPSGILPAGEEIRLLQEREPSWRDALWMEKQGLGLVVCSC